MQKNKNHKIYVITVNKFNNHINYKNEMAKKILNIKKDYWNFRLYCVRNRILFKQLDTDFYRNNFKHNCNNYAF